MGCRNVEYGMLYNWYSARGISKFTSDDYFLPSQHELNKMYTNLHLYSLGSFLAYPYWSSTESEVYPLGYAWAQDFATGTAANTIKSGFSYVRACRSFVSDTAHSLRDIGPSGGYIFDIIDNGNGTYTNYESSTHPDVMVSWSNIINASVGVTGSSVGTGQSNTLLIIAQSGHINSAAKFCNDLVF
jgi:hypothetical protein